ncbi:MAG: lytic transglycosylase domain-containing protein [Parvularculaceae bacterium]
MDRIRLKAAAVGLAALALAAPAIGKPTDADLDAALLGAEPAPRPDRSLDPSPTEEPREASVDDARALTKDAVKRLVARVALEDGRVPASLALAVARVESNFDPDAQSSAGARGVMQIMPATAWGEFAVAADALWDPETNVRLGVAFLGDLYERYGRRWDAALSHYYGGTLPGAPTTAKVEPNTFGYVAKVQSWWSRYNVDDGAQRLIAMAFDEAPVRYAYDASSDEANEPQPSEPARPTAVAYATVDDATPAGAFIARTIEARQRFRAALHAYEADVAAPIEPYRGEPAYQYR